MVRQWLAAAHESYRAAETAFDKGMFRSSASRAYYALYQAGTALMLHLGEVPPSQGNWSHPRLATLFEGGPARRLFGRKAILYKNACIRTYAARIVADYAPWRRLDASDSRQARRWARMVMNRAIEVIGYDPATDHQ
jgi:hypothetical protein